MSRKEAVSTLLIERYRLGELSSREKTRLEKALENDKSLILKMAELDESDREIRELPGARDIADRLAEAARGPLPAGKGPSPGRPECAAGSGKREVSFPVPARRAGQSRRTAGRSRQIPFMCAAAAVVLLALPLTLRLLKTGPAVYLSVPGDRRKGASSAAGLEVYVKQGFSEVTLKEGETLGEGSTIQLAYQVDSSDMSRYGVIFSIDGRAAVTLHYPYSPEQGTELVCGKRTVLDEAYILDDAPGFEMFFFVVSDTALNPDAILPEAEKLAEDPRELFRNSEKALQNGFFKKYDVTIFTLRKE
ncbi:MAG: hypothetical protein LBP69_06505 [Treponema sp.]|jgi:anti-sigma factor RsiW|nr:hypothetical protein [Treponema sp.]